MTFGLGTFGNSGPIASISDPGIITAGPVMGGSTGPTVTVAEANAMTGQSCFTGYLSFPFVGKKDIEQGSVYCANPMAGGGLFGGAVPVVLAIATYGFGFWLVMRLLR